MNKEEIVKYIENYEKSQGVGSIDKITLKDLRKSLQLTQKEFGELLGVKENSITQYEIGRRNVTLSIRQVKIIQILLDLCGLEWHDLTDDLNKEDR